MEWTADSVLPGMEGAATDPALGGVQSGTVKEWNEAAGAGFILPNDGGLDVFVQRSVLTDGKSLLPGALVTYETGWDAANNRPSATLCVGAIESAAAAQPQQQWGGPPQQQWGGCPQQPQWDSQQQWGPPQISQPSDNLFIAGLPVDSTEESVKAIFGPYGTVTTCRVLPYTPGKNDRAALVRLGDIAQAKWLVENLDKNIPLGLSSPVIVKYANKPAPGQEGVKGDGKGDGGWGGGCAQFAVRAPEGPSPTHLTGTVKAWMEDRGMGFLTPSGGGDDVFVHRSELMDGNTLLKGCQVSYEGSWDAVKGKPIARKVYGASDDGSGKGVCGKGAGKVMVKGADKGGDKGKGKGANMFGQWEPPQTAQPMSAYPNLKDGTVKVWFDEKGYGFLTAADGSGDSFIHRTALKDGSQALVQGTAVKFSADWDYQKNRFMTNACFSVGGAPASGGAPPGILPTKPGTVKVWFDDKGFGFISADDGSGDVFTHRSHLIDAQTLTVNAPVKFEATWSFEKNKYIASKVSAVVDGVAANGGWSPAAGNPASVGQAVAQTPVEEVIISGLPSDATPESVKSVFGPYGTILECDMVASAVGPGSSARMKMGSTGQAEWLVTNLNGNMPVGLESPINVVYAQVGKSIENGAENSRFAPY